MIKKEELTVFENYPIRRHYDKKTETWFFSVVDIIAILTGSADPTAYWRKLKERLKKEGNETVTICHGLKMLAQDGKMRLTDVADTETVLRLIQSVPSPKAEPIKLWLAKVGYERLQEITDPERSINRARENYKKLGRSDQWIQRRMMGQETRNKLTDYWKENGIKRPAEFAILTNLMHQEWAEISIKNHKQLKGLSTQNLRDHMSDAELILTALAELSTRQIAETRQSQGLKENKISAKKGGKIAKDTRKALEEETNQQIVTNENFLYLKDNLDNLEYLKNEE